MGKQRKKSAAKNMKKKVPITFQEWGRQYDAKKKARLAQISGDGN